MPDDTISTEAEMPKEKTAGEPEAQYSMLDFQREAATFETNAPAIAGIFREADNPDTMTEAEFRQALARWHGDGN
jgi:hypothetical protein